MVSFNKITEPPAITYLNEENLTKVKTSRLKFMHACHNRAVERLVKIVCEAASQVTSFEKRDGFIRRKIRSRKLVKQFDTKSQFLSKYKAI